MASSDLPSGAASSAGKTLWTVIYRGMQSHHGKEGILLRGCSSVTPSMEWQGGVQMSSGICAAGTALWHQWWALQCPSSFGLAEQKQPWVRDESVRTMAGQTVAGR